MISGGHGDSSKPLDEKFYSIETLAGDIETVATVNGLQEYFIWGFSLGASIALYMSAMRSVKGVVAAGSYFGKELSDHARRNIPGLQQVLRAKKANRLDDVPLSPAEKYFVDNADLDVALALYTARAKWPKIEPGMVSCPVFLYAGTDDEPTCSVLSRQSSAIRQAGIQLRFITGLDHFQVLTEKDRIMPEVINFLSACQV